MRRASTTSTTVGSGSRPSSRRALEGAGAQNECPHALRPDRRNRSQMIWWLLLVMSVCTGLLRVPWWTVLVWPVTSVVLGVYFVADEPANYDMHGFGYGLGGFV